MNKIALITGVTGQDGSYLSEFLLSFTIFLYYPKSILLCYRIWAVWMKWFATGVQHSVREFCQLAFHYAGIELEFTGRLPFVFSRSLRTAGTFRRSFT